MVRNVFREEFEAYKSRLGTSWGLITFIFGELIWGYLIISYIDKILEFIVSTISFLPTYLIEPSSWILFSLFSSTLGLAILYILVMIVKAIGIKNRNIDIIK